MSQHVCRSGVVQVAVLDGARRQRVTCRHTLAA